MRKRFLQDRKPYEMKNSSKNTFPQDKKWLLHNFNNGFHQQKEYYNTKEYYFTYAEGNFTAFVSASGNYC